MKKKLYIFMLCFILIFPTIGHVVQAESQSNEEQLISNLESEITIEETDTIGENLLPTDEEDSSTNIKVQESSQTTEVIPNLPDEKEEDNQVDTNNMEKDSKTTVIEQSRNNQPSSVEKSTKEEENANSQKRVTKSNILPSEHVVIEGNTKFYVNNNEEVNYAEVYVDNTLIKIQEYYTNSKVEDSNKRIKHIFELDSNGHITNAAKLDELTQMVSNQYQYYPQTVYGEHGNNIRFIFDLNASGHVIKASMREKGTKQILSRYQYYPQTKYGDHGNNIKYIFDLDSSGFVNHASLREKGTKQILSRYQYYPQTKYGDHGSNIKYIFDLDSSGFVNHASLREKGTKRILSRYQYYSKTTYGAHGNNIKYIFDLNKSGYITSASMREKGTKRILSRYQYYPKTTYGVHGNNIKYIFDINKSGYVTDASKREKGTKRILTRYQYYPKTVYGSHAENIKYLFYMNNNGTVSHAHLRESNKNSNGTFSTAASGSKTQTLQTFYSFKPGTKYGNHWSNVSGIKLDVPIISQLPELPTGCEITAVTMMLQYMGANVDKVALAFEMPKHSWNPSMGYVGDPFNTRGWTIHPSALMGTIRNHAGSAQNLTGASNQTIEKQLSNNKPVVVWVSPMHGFSVHALVLTGFDKNNYYFNDCWTGQKDVKMNKTNFNKIWADQSKRAISY